MKLYKHKQQEQKIWFNIYYYDLNVY
jgi:hypothetical protein